MRLTYINHSGFAIEAPNYTIIIDFFEDSLGKDKGVVYDRILYRSSQKLYVLCTHAHSDHFNPDVFKWKDIRSDITYIFSKDIQSSSNMKMKDVIFLDKDEVYTDELVQIIAYGSTDIGVSFKIKADNRVMFHAGDLNNWHWNEESTLEEIAEAEDWYYRELDHVAASTPHLDLAMFPVDPRLGSDYMMGAEQFLEKIPTRLFIPMHFGGEYDKAKAIGDYAKKLDTKVYVPTRKGEILENLEDVIDGN